jgi:hypothetical protein
MMGAIGGEYMKHFYRLMNYICRNIFSNIDLCPLNVALPSLHDFMHSIDTEYALHSESGAKSLYLTPLT